MFLTFLVSRAHLPHSLTWRYSFISIAGSLWGRIVFRRKVWRQPRMKNADSLDVAATRRPQGKSCDSASRLRLHTQKIIKNDRCGIVRLSKIAHMLGINVEMPGLGQTAGSFNARDEESSPSARLQKRQTVLTLDRQASRIPGRSRSKLYMCGV